MRALPAVAAAKMRRADGEDRATGLAAEAATDVQRFLSSPAVLPHLRLGQPINLSCRATLALWLLLRLHPPAMFFTVLQHLTGWDSRFENGRRLMDAYFYWRAARKTLADDDTWRRLIHGPVILMYHAIGLPGERGSRYVLPQRIFARHMAWLKKHRYNVIPLPAFLAWRERDELAPARSVILTFDDGYRDNLTVAYPILARYGFAATVFVVTGSFGQANRWDNEGELAGRQLLTVSDLAELRAGRISIGAHSRTHPALPDVPSDQLIDEIRGSRDDLEAVLREDVSLFAYPHGRYTSAVSDAVAAAGFRAVCTSDSGTNDPTVALNALRRLEVRGDRPMLDFILGLELGQTRILHRLWHAQ